MSLLKFCDWLATTPASPALRDSVWVYLIVESVHVLSLCLFVGFVVCLDFRLIGLAIRRIPVTEVAERLLPLTMTGFAVMVLSGSLLFYSDPVRFYHNVFFRMKVVMLLLAGLNAAIFHWTVFRNVKEWNLAHVTPPGARFAGGFSLALWGLIIVTGRLIAYNWFDVAN